MKKQFLEAYEEENRKRVQQQRLREKHDIEDPNVIVVEKSNMIKFSVKSLASVVRIAASIVILCLAAVGLLCIIYPSTRMPLQEELNQLWVQCWYFFMWE